MGNIMSLPNYKNLPDNSVLCLMSPTASGKTALAFRLHDTARFDIISVDSALIYRDMNIGTAKPSQEELLRHPHALVDILLPTESYSVADFIQDVAHLIEESHNRQKIPLLVGGTMMYYMALFDGISGVPQTRSDIRAQVNAWQQAEGNEALYAYLQKHDPDICQKLTVHDTQRICRAVEVHLQTQTPMSVHQNTPKVALAHNPNQHWYGLCVMPDRAWLHHRIEQRLELMWQDGFLQEVIDIVNRYELTVDMPSMRSVGYRQALEYLILFERDKIEHSHLIKTLQMTQNQPNLDNFHTNMQVTPCQDMKNKALYATRQLAKRQYTWLSKLSLLGVPTTNDILTTTMMSYNNIEQIERLLLA